VLNVHSYFSFKYGLVSIDQLIEWAKRHKMRTLALTDINSTAGSLEFVRQAKKHHIRPILGIDFRNGAKQQFLGIAKNNAGFQALNTFLSYYLHQAKPIPSSIDSINDCFIIYPLENAPSRPLEEYEYIGIRPYEVNKARFLKSISQEKLIACPTYTFVEQGPQERNVEYNLHCILRAIDLNTLVSKLEPTDTAHVDDLFLTKSQLCKAYEELPYAFDNLKYVVKSSEIQFDFGTESTTQNMKTWGGTEKNDYRKVRTLCLDGMLYRYGEKPAFTVKRRIITELKVIRKKNFLSYFLVSWDIVSYARSMGYFYVGRGSGANSVVAYLLRITDVDPIELDLYFERFINLFRQTPPDFDIDFSSKERDNVTQYIFDRYDNAVLLATHNTFQHKAVIREVGKTFGIPPFEIDKIQMSEIKDLDQRARLIRICGERLTGFPSHLSVHAGGVLISERPIHYFTATSLPPKGFPITHFDMLLAEDVGLFKFDILGQRGLGKIKDGLEIIRENRPNEPLIDIHDVKRFKNDELVKENLREAKAIGCFYVESPAMRMLLKKLKVDEYLGLVAASSIIRPGVAKSGMMREYILRFRYPEKRKEAHHIMMDIMPETFGVMVYQEDVIKVAHYFAGLTLGEADVLRRGMSGKYRSREEFQKVRNKYFSNCEEKGYSGQLSQEIWRQIESFAGYAFAKGHSASYAIESYQSLYLKSHYPLEFMVAVINNGGGFYAVELYVHEARMHGGEVFPPCVNKSENLCVIHGKEIHLGFFLVKDLENRVTKVIVQERWRAGYYKSMEDLVKRIDISLDQLSVLIRVGAFGFTGKNKKELLWRAHFLLTKRKMTPRVPQLFAIEPKKYTLPELNIQKFEDAFDEMELIGFPLTSPFHTLRSYPNSELCTRDFPKHLNKNVTILGYLITIKTTRTSKGDVMQFGTFLDMEGQFIDTVHFPPVAAKYPFRGKGIYTLHGKIVEEFEFYSLEVNRMQKELYIEDPRYSDQVALV
jgi:DNA-directed DNA polymerase III PolC